MWSSFGARILIGAVLLVFLLTGGLTPISAQVQGAPVSQTQNRADYAAILTTATAGAGSAATATVTPLAGLSVYVTALEITACGDDTGDAAAATPSTFTLAGFTTNAIFKVNSTHTAGV